MSCLERVEKTLECIERNELNTFITLNKEGAIERAHKIDRSESPEGRLSGVPVAIKDAITTRGIETTCASRILGGYIPPYDAHVIECLLLEGAIIIGKTNMDEFSMGTSTETSCFGPTLNPHDKTRVPGGSSGGSAASVAAGEVPLALGSDTGGSIRCPASFCGVVGLKTTYGLVSRYGLIAYANSLEQIGPIGKTVPDVARLLDVISRPDPRDSTQVGSEGGYSDKLTPTLAGVRIAVPSEFFGEGVDEAVEGAVWDMIHKAEELGATYQEVSIPSVKYALAAYYIIAMSEASSNLARFDGMRYGLRLEDTGNWHDTFSKIRQEGFGTEVKRRILLGTYALSAGYYGRYYLKALKVRRMIKEEFDKILKDFDLLFTPTMPFTAFRIGEKINDPLSLYLADVNTVPINLAGSPSISIPAGYSDGLPIGLQIIGRYFEEQQIMNAAYALFGDGEDE
ncbi:MAG: Amidase [Candidatus Syntrophoarchaeum sp. GoM_oil]|nr:MAG: Amidase [Candidatus Syntrophoarchaeum sp. GoM_oil]